jgi:DNA-binding response OmpR family regulator
VLADYLPDELEMYTQGLRARGLTVVPVVTRDCSAAAEIISRTPCAAVVTRILPDRFGIDLTRRLRAALTTARLPIVVITSLSSDDLRLEARAAGATDVLLLPQTPEQVARAVKRAIKHAPAA